MGILVYILEMYMEANLVFGFTWISSKFWSNCVELFYVEGIWQKDKSLIFQRRI
jgi:hypothetical protein